jgi:DNA polymerase-1
MRTIFVLIDAHSIIFRSYYAFIQRPLKNSKGQVTSGIFGFLKTLEKIKENIGKTHIALCFDAPGKTFRDEVFEEYKATRPAAPPDIPFQIEKVKEICQYLGIPRFELEGYEADDILATFAKRLKDHGEVYIATSDKDLMQLVGKTVFVYDAYKNIIYDRAEVIKKFGVPPERVGDYLALTGDTIDNIPGVPGIGPKRAVAIIKKYQRLDTAIEKENRIAGHEAQVQLSRKLVELADDVPIKIAPEDLEVQSPDKDKLMPILIELELHSVIKNLMATPSLDLEIVKLSDLTVLKDSDCLGICLGGNDTVLLSTGGLIVYELAIKNAQPIFHDMQLTKAGYRIKECIARCGAVSPCFDAEIAAWLIDPNRGRYKFDDIVLHHLNAIVRTDPASIAHHSYHLMPVLIKKLGTQMKLYTTIEEPLIRILALMEERGVRIDLPYLRTLSSDFATQINRIEREIHKLAGRKFNVNSPKQLSAILFEDLGLKPTRKGKTHYSTSVDVLQELSREHDLPKEVLDFREYSKIKSTYIDPLITLARKSRIHTTFNQTGTSTGRLSSSDPNIQNIPIRTEVGRTIRKGFIADKGYVLCSADYSQVELRLLAHITGDNALIEAFKQNKDIHRHTASLVFNIPEHEVTDTQRRMAKVVNYGLIYGMSEFGLAHRLDIPHEEAMHFIDSYYNLYSGVAAWREKLISSAEECGYVETLLGRKRPVPEIISSIYGDREFAKRAAINAPIQGTAADLIKIAMINTEKRLSQAGFSRGLLLSIHDELVFEIEEPRVEEARAIIEDAMVNALELNVPIEVSIGIGQNWDEAH